MKSSNSLILISKAPGALIRQNTVTALFCLWVSTVRGGDALDTNLHLARHNRNTAPLQLYALLGTQLRLDTHTNEEKRFFDEPVLLPARKHKSLLPQLQIFPIFYN